MKRSLVCVVLWLAACAEQPASPPESAPRPPVATAPTSAPAAPPVSTASSPAPPNAADASPPPLSTPNALALPTDDAGPEAAPLNLGSSRTQALRRIAVHAQNCHARHAPGIKGRLTLRVTPDSSGAVAKLSIDKSKTSAELRLAAFESCVLDAVKKETLWPARDADDQVELPLTFDP
ncbi:MAG: hypothetical protein IPI67_35210 [Myxococcales bacterium]|nr:hypothetical protein [Myxococcales bacterium]